MDLEGRVIAIAGAAGGLGPVVAARIAEQGASLALTDRDQSRLDAVVADLAIDPERIDSRVVDLLDDSARPAGRMRSASASAASTACCTWSAAGVAASRSRPRRWPTTSGSTTSWCGP